MDKEDRLSDFTSFHFGKLTMGDSAFEMLPLGDTAHYQPAISQALDVNDYHRK